MDRKVLVLIISVAAVVAYGLVNSGCSPSPSGAQNQKPSSHTTADSATESVGVISAKPKPVVLNSLFLRQIHDEFSGTDKSQYVRKELTASQDGLCDSFCAVSRDGKWTAALNYYEQWYDKSGQASGGEPHPLILRNPEGAVFSPAIHTEGITAATFSHNRDWLVLADREDRVRVWMLGTMNDGAEEEWLRRMPVSLAGGIDRVICSPNDYLVAAFTQNGLQVMRLRDGEVVARLDPRIIGRIHAAAFVDFQTLVIAGRPRYDDSHFKIVVWRPLQKSTVVATTLLTKAIKETDSFPPNWSRITALAIDPRRTRVVVATEKGQLFRLSYPHLKQLAVRHPYEGEISLLATTSGERVAYLEEGKIRVIDFNNELISGEWYLDCPAYAQRISSVGDNSVVVQTLDKKVKLHVED